MEQATPIGVDNCGDGINRPLLDSKSTQGGEPESATEQHSNSTNESLWTCARESLPETAIELECKQNDVPIAKEIATEILLSCKPRLIERCLIMEQTLKNADKDAIHIQSYAEARQPELSYSRAQEDNTGVEPSPREANLIETKCILVQPELEIIPEVTDISIELSLKEANLIETKCILMQPELVIIPEVMVISEPKHNPQEIPISEKSSEDIPANKCDVICPEYTTGMKRGNCTPITLILSLRTTHTDIQDQCGSEQDNECTDVVNDTKCAQIPEEVSQTIVLVNEVTLMPECGTEACQQMQLPGEVYQSSALVNEEVKLIPGCGTEACQQVKLPGEVDQRLVNEEVRLIPDCGTEVCQQVQLPGEVYQSSALVKHEMILIPKCAEAFQQVRLPGEDVLSSTSQCQNVQLHNKFDGRCSTTVEAQGEVVIETKCVMPSVEAQQQAEDVTRVCADVVSIPKPAVSGCKPGWCGTMELEVLSSVELEEEKFSFIESDNELEEDEMSSGQDRCEEVNDNKVRQWETSIVGSNKEIEGVSKEGELPFTISTVVEADNCDSVSGNQQDCIDVSRYNEDACGFPLVLGEDLEGNEPASKRPRFSSEAKHDECTMEPEIVCERPPTTDADDGSETLLQGLPTESASHWPALPNAPPCHRVHREDDNDGSPPDDSESGQTYPNTYHAQISMSCDNQLVPEEYSRDHNQLVSDETFQEHRKAYSLYSNTHVGLNKPVSNSLEVLESLPSVHLTSLHFPDQVIPRSPVDTCHQARYHSCFEQRDAIASKLLQTQVAPMNQQQSGVISRRPRLRLGLSKKQKIKPLHIN